MKKLLMIVTLLLVVTILRAQDCLNAEDCLNKGKSSNFESEAFDFYNKALKLAKKEGSNASNIYLYRGIKYYQLYTPNLKEAEKDFKAAIKEDEKNIYPYLWLANVYAYGEKDYKKGNDYLTELLKKFPNNPQVLRERANNNKYYNNTSMAATDYEMAYNLIMDDPTLTDARTAAEIVRWHAELYMRSKSQIFADATTLAILESGLKLAPDSAPLLGDLALAYYDNNNSEKAFEMGAKAHAIDKSNVGSLFVAMKALETQDYWTAATLMWEADRNVMHSHPLVYFYFASAQWGYCYNVAQNQWANNKEIIRNRLQLAVQYGSGTSYNWCAEQANQMLATIDN
jgi:tetratricopeptide (TPR) repeat protein